MFLIGFFIGSMSMLFCICILKGGNSMEDLDYLDFEEEKATKELRLKLKEKTLKEIKESSEE